MTSEKRKKVVVSIDEKYKAIQRMDSGESAQAIAKSLGVGRTTVIGWQKSRVEIMNWCLSHAGPSTSKIERKTMKKSDFENVGEALYLWFVQQREKGTPISGPMLKEKALNFYSQLRIECPEEEKFTASEGWLFRWKRRYGIRQLNICGERLSAEGQASELQKFKRRLHKFLDKKGLSGEQIYNCDETGLYYRMLPSKTLASVEEKSAPGYKKSKDRVTVLACSNVTGSHKLPLVVIGKCKKPRAFKKIKKGSSLPVSYHGQKSAWMNSQIFESWFHGEFVPAVRQFLETQNLPQRAILIVDNAPSHPSNLQDGDIRVWFFPPNVTSIGQPMDQGVLENLKKKYRRKLLSSVLNSDENLVQKLKEVDMVDVIRWIAASWDELLPITIVKSWKKILDHKASNKFEGEETECDERTADDSELLELLRRIPECEDAVPQDVDEWMDQDDNFEYGDNDILELVTGKMNEEEEGVSDEEAENESSEIITHTAAFQIFEQALQYVTQEADECTAADVILLRKWRDFAAKKRITSAKQMSIDAFLKK